MAEKYLDYSGTDLLWKKILKLFDKKLEKVESFNDSIKVTDSNKISVNISESENNLLQLIPGEGLYVRSSGVMHKLTFGADQEYVYDGTKDVTVPVYTGKTN